MAAMPAPLRRWLPPVAWTAGALLALFVALMNGAEDHGRVHGLRYFLPALAVLLPAGLLRRAPLPGLALMLACSCTATTTLHSAEQGYLWDIRYLQFLVIDLAVGFVAAHRPRRISVAGAAMALAVQVAVAVLHPLPADFLSQSPALIGLALLTAWLIGNSLRQRREVAAARNAQAAAQALTVERLRIARELHDMVAHTIGVIAIQAGAGSRIFHTQPARAHETLQAIEATSRETLAGLRRMLGTLRTPDADPGPDPADADPADPGAPPGLGDLDRLVASAGRAGVRVDVRTLGEPRPVPADLDLTAFRIIQEAVTNVVRHAATADCLVTVDYREAELTIEIVDSGHGAPEGGQGGQGYGLIGMRERVGLLCGELTAGPRAAGGFEVAARLPMPVGG